jgi:hypothetical protein
MPLIASSAIVVYIYACLCSRKRRSLALTNEAGVALLVCAAGTEACADEGGPGATLEQEDGEDDAEGQAEGGADQEGGEAAVPL